MLKEQFENIASRLEPDKSGIPTIERKVDGVYFTLRYSDSNTSSDSRFLYLMQTRWDDTPSQTSIVYLHPNGELVPRAIVYKDGEYKDEIPPISPRSLSGKERAVTSFLNHMETQLGNDDSRWA